MNWTHFSLRVHKEIIVDGLCFDKFEKFFDLFRQFLGWLIIFTQLLYFHNFLIALNNLLKTSSHLVYGPLVFKACVLISRHSVVYFLQIHTRIWQLNKSIFELVNLFLENQRLANLNLLLFQLRVDVLQVNPLHSLHQNLLLSLLNEFYDWVADFLCWIFSYCSQLIFTLWYLYFFICLLKSFNFTL